MATATKTQKQPGRLTVARLQVHGVLGIEDSTIDLSTITLLEGKNGSSKSSHIKALRSALGIDRTSLARLARVREDGTPDDKPYVEVLLVGEDQELRVTKKGDQSADVDYRVGGAPVPIKRPVEWLRDLVDTQGANPAVWLALDDEAKAGAVLEAMPLEGYDRAAALEAAGLQNFHLPRLADGLHPLEELEQIEAAVFASRTQVHADERREHDAATKLLADLPAQAPEDASEEVARLDAEVAELRDSIGRQTVAAENAERAAVERATTTFKGEVARLRADQDKRQAEIRADADKRIAEIEAECQRRCNEVKAGVDVDVEKAGTAAQEARTAARTALDKARASIAEKEAALATKRERLVELRASQQSIETDHRLRTMAAEAEQKARGYHAKAKAFSAAIDALRRYRLELAERLPIKGLAVKFDDKGRKSLTLDGVPLSQVNDGRLAELATEVSLLRTKPPKPGQPYLPIVLLDGLERVDPAARAALLREIASRGSQVIAAVVGNDALRVLTDERAAVTA